MSGIERLPRDAFEKFRCAFEIGFGAIGPAVIFGKPRNRTYRVTALDTGRLEHPGEPIVIAHARTEEHLRLLLRRLLIDEVLGDGRSNGDQASLPCWLVRVNSSHGGTFPESSQPNRSW
jgi:hypothetical protein